MGFCFNLVARFTSAMSSQKSNFLYFLLSAIVLWAGILGLYPLLQNYVDPDATSYLRLSARYLEGDTAGAINAYWSPLSIWLSALWQATTGMGAFDASLWVNALACLGTLWCSQVIFHRWNAQPWARICFAVFFGLFWAYACYKQLFADIWQYFFLLLFYLIIIDKKTSKRPYLWPILGLVAALAFFGKAVAFYFLPLFLFLFLMYQVYICKEIKVQRAALMFASVILVQCLAVSPWVYLLYEKYGIITLSTAGSLNMSWFLTGTQHLDPSIRAVIPPPVPGGVFCFEDPYLYQGEVHSMWQRPQLFFKQIIRSIYNYFNWQESTAFLSSFYFVVWLGTILHFGSKARWKRDPALFPILLFFLLYPLPFWLMTFDAGRHLWITLPFMTILALYLAAEYLFPKIENWAKQVFIFVLFASLISAPILDVRKLAFSGNEEKEIAAKLEQLGISGAFVSNHGYDSEHRFFILRLAHFSRNPWYCHIHNEYTEEEILVDAQRYKVPYYFYFYKGTGEQYQLKDASGNDFEEVSKGQIPGLKIFRIDR